MDFKRLWKLKETMKYDNDSENWQLTKKILTILTIRDQSFKHLNSFNGYVSLPSKAP